MAEVDSQLRADVAHLVRRVAFGAPAGVIDELAALGYEGAVDALCDFDGPDRAAEAVQPPEFHTIENREARRSDDPAARKQAAAQRRQARRALVLWWLRRMVAADHPARERLAFVWHDHFATSLQKVKTSQLMYGQIDTIERLGPGRFDTLAIAIARDPAMLIWLDGAKSRAGAPNENFGREFLELFTLGHGTGADGHGDHGGQPYTEDDVKGASRAFTGWVIRRADVPGGAVGQLNPRRHDGAAKTVLGVTGNLGLEDVVEAATSHPACAPFIVSCLWSRIGRPATPDDPVVKELAAPFAEDLDTAALLRRMLLHPAFLAEETRRSLIRPPVDFVVGLARSLGFDLDERALAVLAGLGQVPCNPPSVGGWPANEAWVSTASALTRLRVADFVANAVGGDIAGEGLAPAERPEHLRRLLGIDEWGERSAAVLSSAPDSRTALTLAIVAPEYLVA